MCSISQVHGAKLFICLKILQHKTLNMFREHLLNLEVLIMGDEYHIFQKGGPCFCKRQNSSVRPDDSSFVLYYKSLFTLWDSNNQITSQLFAQIISHFHKSHLRFQKDCLSEAHWRYFGWGCLNSNLRHFGFLKRKRNVASSKCLWLNLFPAD